MEIKNLSKSIDNIAILNNINISIPKGKITGIVGRNGSGKTTLFRTIASHFLLDSGEILIDGESINKKESLKNKIFYLDTQFQALSKMDLRKIEEYFSLIYPSFDTQVYKELISKYDLPNKSFHKYSKGMQCLLVLIVGFCSNCNYILLDEPLDGLDSIVRKQVKDLIIDSISEQERGVLLASHNLNELERLADQVVFLKNNTIVSNLDLSNLNSTMKKIQIIFKDGKIPDEIAKKAAFISQEGRVVIMIFSHYSSDLKQKILDDDPIFYEELSLSLEDLFSIEFEQYQ